MALISPGSNLPYQLAFRLDEELLNAIEEAAEENGRHVAQEIRWQLKQALLVREPDEVLLIEDAGTEGQRAGRALGKAMKEAMRERDS